jgi:SAM-dependent methyltransferase
MDAQGGNPRSNGIPCPACGHREVVVFYEASGVPVHSAVLLVSREVARHYPTGDIRLSFCAACGFIFNRAFDAQRLAYNEHYDPTQAFSPTFNAFHRQLAQHLIDRYGLRNRIVLEIGCGKGEFLSLLCRLGDNRGIGLDPCYVEDGSAATPPGQVTFVRDFFSERYADCGADVICAKMTLEHVPEVAAFIGSVRRVIGARDTLVFFQVPAVTRILRDSAFWDIYYEHCSYFSGGVLAALFRRAGFSVIEQWTDYDDQYVMLVARPAAGGGDAAGGEDLEELRAAVTRFPAAYREKRAHWAGVVRQLVEAQRRVVIWGAGSKAVAFLAALRLGDEIPFLVDINPRKHGTFLPGSGHEVVAPHRLSEYRPDTVILMNPIYLTEVERDLRQMGLSPDLVAVR